MLVIIASDSHGKSEKLIDLEKKYPQAEAFLFAGDLMDDPNKLLNWILVRGNNDKEYLDLLPETTQVDLKGHKTLILHSDKYPSKTRKEHLAALAKKNEAQIVVYGHSHQADIDKIQDIWLLNPGSLFRPRGKKGISWIELYITETQIEPKIIYERR